jgi:O-antigen biosynthesis protein
VFTRQASEDPTRPERRSVRVLSPAAAPGRPVVRGKFLFVGSEKLYVRGVTYGTFRPDASGHEYPRPAIVEQDFAAMARIGLNAVRTYTVPPRAMLDAASRHGLRVMVGLCAERHIGFLVEGRRDRDAIDAVAAAVRTCAGHPAILCYTLANEIPAPIVRWLGHRRVERYLARIYRAVKAEDPGGLVTYVNYPTTEYLQLPFLDLASFNVYLEAKDRFEAYLARLHNLAGERPLLMTELGLDSLRNGEELQARVLDWQLRTALGAGCAGAFVFAWTDEWHRGGEDVLDWRFGITARDRQPKPALGAVLRAFAEALLSPPAPPRISVVVCTYNGARTIRDTLEGLHRLEYPDFEVIVVDDGSTDGSGTIARDHGFRVIRTENRGLSSARNTGLAAATGDIVAYIDDDAWPDPHWLTYLATVFQRTGHAGVGGPNMPPPGDGWIAECVANAPGGPLHVLISDTEAEHLPGCNMAFRRTCLEAIGGFDAQFRVAGDDVDVCWRIRDRGWTLGFSPAAVVWHHRRNSVRAYVRQQLGYGKAEALLERKWPERYNALGHVRWSGRLYGRGVGGIGFRSRIYHGCWGEAPFQPLYQQPRGRLAYLQVPEWYMVIAALVVLSGVGLLWRPLLAAAVPLLAVALAATVAAAAVSAHRASFSTLPATPLERAARMLVIAALHLIQPAARLRGRLGHGLAPWRLCGRRGFHVPWRSSQSIWTEEGLPAARRLALVEEALRRDGLGVARGGDFDRWDLEVRCGLLGSARLLMAVEEHGGGRQYVRLRYWPRCSAGAALAFVMTAGLSADAALEGAWAASALLGAAGVLIASRLILECGRAIAAIQRAAPAGARQGA